MKISNLLTIALSFVVFTSQVEAGRLTENWGIDSVSAPKAWKLAEHGSEVRVCVVDTGVDTSHFEFKDRICNETQAKEYGWDFVNHKMNPIDLDGHGTHVAGIIKAVAPSACIIPVKWYAHNLSEKQYIRNTTDAFYYCIKRGAKIINYSGGGSATNSTEKQRELDAIKMANSYGIPVVVAAGNEHRNLDTGGGFFPASYDLPNIIAVASVNANGKIAATSSWGVDHVQLAAPGDNILSTIPHDDYGIQSGTSMAAPFVTGIVAILLSKYPNLTIVEIKDILIESVSKKSELENRVSSGGIVNAYKAMVKAKELSLQKIEEQVE